MYFKEVVGILFICGFVFVLQLSPYLIVISHLVAENQINSHVKSQAKRGKCVFVCYKINSYHSLLRKSENRYPTCSILDHDPV